MICNPITQGNVILVHVAIIPTSNLTIHDQQNLQQFLLYLLLYD